MTCDDDYVVCPKCMGSGDVRCLCGGDFCLCENQGKKDCHLCFGDGDVSKECSDTYLRRAAEIRDAIKLALANALAER